MFKVPLLPRWFVDYTAVVFAGLLYAVALHYFVLPARVVLTGTEGIAVAVAYYLESGWLFIVLYALFQALLIGFAFFRVSRTFAIRSAIVVTTVVIALSLLPTFRFADPEPQNERLILVLFGGILSGVAKAIAFRKRGSTGDEDILGAYFAMKTLKPVGSIAIIAGAVSTAFGLALVLLKTGEFEVVVNTLMYTCIYIFASAETLNNLYHKFKITMLVVITSEPETVRTAIAETSTHRTSTVQQGIGGRSGNAFGMVRTIITQEELPMMREAIEQAEPTCFLYFHDLEGVSQRYRIEPIS